MSFLSPAFLFGFLALIPLATIYFLKVRPRKKSTTAYFLWEKIFSQKKATSLFSRLRDLFSLLLMLLAFSAVVLALAQPEFTDDERKDLLILIDHSASMSAGEGGKSRLEQARETAREIVTALNGNQRAAVASVARELEYRSHLTASPRELLDATDAVPESDFPFDARALEGLGQDAQWARDHRILLLSDGNFSGADSLPENIELFKIGERADNAGIVAADLQRLPDGRLGFYFRIASSFEEPVKADLVLKNPDAGDQIFRLIPLDIQPGENPAEVFNLEDAPAGKWTATLEIEDALEKDNVAWLAVPEIRPVRVQVAAEDRFFFQTSVLAFERGSGLLQLVDENPEIVIDKGSAPSTSQAELSVIFTPDGDSPWWKTLGGETVAVAPRVMIEDHPVLRHVDVASIAFIGAREIVPADGSLVLVESESGAPLIYRASHDGKTALVINLDPIASEFYFSAWFPTLIHGTSTYLAGRQEELAAVYRPGDSAPVPGYRDSNSPKAIVTLPDGESTADVFGGEFGPIESLGFYEMENPSGAWPLGSSLITAAESVLDNAAIAATAEPVSRGHAPAYWLVVLAILLLIGESILYHRRKVG